MALTPEKMEEIVGTLSELTILEVADLVKKLEEKWGVSAAAPVLLREQVPLRLPAQHQWQLRRKTLMSF